LISFHHGLPRGLSRDVKLKKVVRYATAEDVEKAGQLPFLEEEAMAVVNQKVAEHELKMKVINLEYVFDLSRLIIYYKIDERKKAPNVRDLAKELSTLLKTRAEMKQVSPRDEARILGGLGPCGRPLCCSVWLEKPKHVTVKMVKEQGLALSPTKTAGVCGRLLCCLEYEHEKK
jgi:cell fate regulator YaaT (PSP1 superfamily)